MLGAYGPNTSPDFLSVPQSAICQSKALRKVSKLEFWHVVTSGLGFSKWKGGHSKPPFVSSCAPGLDFGFLGWADLEYTMAPSREIKRRLFQGITPGVGPTSARCRQVKPGRDKIIELGKASDPMRQLVSIQFSFVASKTKIRFLELCCV